MIRVDIRPLANARGIEWLLFLQPVLATPTADAMLLGVVETAEAAQAIAAALNKVFGCVHSHQPAI